MRRRERTVVDTNVLIAGNRRGTHVDEQCQLRCADAILELRRNGDRHPDPRHVSWIRRVADQFARSVRPKVPGGRGRSRSHRF